MRAQVVGNGRSRARIPRVFAAALQALEVESQDINAVQSLSDGEWRELLPTLDHARLALPLAQLEYRGLPGWVTERLGNILADTAQHWQLVQQAYREIAAIFDAQGLEHLVLKGFTQAPEFVSRPELRRQGDIDVYVPREQIPAAVHALTGIGYSACYAEEDSRDADHVPTLVRFGTWKWHGNRYDPDMPPAVEVHFCLWNDSVSSIAIPEIESFWSRRRIRSLGELTFPALHPVDHVGYVAMHILRDVILQDTIGGGCSAHHVRELAVFLHRRAGDDEFWREWAAMHSPRLRSLEAIAFSFAHAWFSCSLPGAVREQIDSIPSPIRAWIETCGYTPLESLFRRTREARLLHSLLVETPQARRRILWKALTPGRVQSPDTRALRTTHPTRLPRRDLRTYLSTYLSYPGYLISRIWMNGCAILRLLSRASMLYLRPRRSGQFWGSFSFSRRAR